MSIHRTTPTDPTTTDGSTRRVTWLRQRTPRRRAVLLTGDYLQSWLDGRLALRPSTAASYRSHIDRYLTPLIGSIPLAELQPEDVQRLHHQLLAQGMTPATLARVHATLSAALHTAERRNLLTADPLAGVELPRADHPDQQVWTLRQARTFLAAVRGDALEGLWRLALITGMRRGELLALRWADLDLDRGLLTVRSNRVAVGGTIIEGRPKSRAGRRTLHLDPHTTRTLRHHQNTADHNPTGHVFTGHTGQPLTPWWVSRRFTQLVEQAGLPPIRLHDLRHTSATLGLAHGESLKAVSTRLGHSDITITANTYTAVPDDIAHQDAARLAHRLDTTREASE